MKRRMFEEDKAIGQREWFTWAQHSLWAYPSPRDRGLMSKDSSPIFVFCCFLGLGSVSDYFRSSSPPLARIRDHSYFTFLVSFAAWRLASPSAVPFVYWKTLITHVDSEEFYQWVDSMR